MVEPPKTRLQSMLQAAVQSVRWTYSLFWQLCPQQGILVWCDGYYNGPIKTRKTIQPTEVTTEEATLHRSQQLRELYESLSAGETSHQARRPSAALSPEDLTESEWFYLMCVSFSFPPGVGLPGKAYVKRQHIWLTRANEADSKVFPRAILAKSARIQTVVCIPLLDGVVELGTTQRAQEDIALIQRVKSFFSDDGQNPNHPPRPAPSEHSTSNPQTYSEPRFNSPGLVPTFLPMESSHVAEESEDDGQEGFESDSDPNHQDNVAAQPMQLDVSEDIRFRSPDVGSNNLNSDFEDLLAMSRSLEDHRSMEKWPSKDPMSSNFRTRDELEQVDTHYYTQTVSTILGSQSTRWSNYSSSTAMSSATPSAFSKWSSYATPSPDHRRKNRLLDGPASQCALKHILFTVPLLHAKPFGRSGTSPAEELNAGHILAERRRREKLNERFIILRSLVPFVTKMDKASILGDTIEYLKQLRKKIQELESEKINSIGVGPTSRRKMSVVVGRGGKRAEGVESRSRAGAVQVEVSIIERDALVEIECVGKEGLLLKLMQVLGELGIEVTTVQSSVSDGVFTAELRAKVKENANGRKASIMEVKRSINQIIRHY